MQILAVVVRYKMELRESATIAGLLDAFAEAPSLQDAYRVLVWDNTPEALESPELPFAFHYRHSARNLGTSGAYNGAMQFAQENGYPWMLLLDQDTTVTAEFLGVMAEHARLLLGRGEVAAIAPTVHVRNIVVSPKKQLFSRNRHYPSGECGIAGGEAIAINSGCIMRASSLRSIGGFSLEFWLDYSDLYVFHQFFRHGMKVWRATDAHLEHEMSIMDYDRLMTPWRYRNFSYAETAFHDLYKGRLENLIQTARVFARAIKQRFKYRNPEFSRIAWQQWKYRVSTTKKHRIRRWMAESAARQSEASSLASFSADAP